MNAPAFRHILLMGLQSTGKTSYLAALWYMLDQTTVPCALSLKNLDGDRSYLNLICKAWMEYKAVLRTPSDSEKLASMTLKDKQSNQLKLIFPDLSGESFLLQWSKRQLTVGYDQLMKQANGGILFLSSEKVEQPVRIDTVVDLVAEVNGSADEAPPVPVPPTAIEPWDIEKAPTQVQLVELLQVIASREYFRAPFRLAIVLSAFDVVKSLGLTPKQFISRQLPLLDQYLTSNSYLFDVTIYGISAQGGRYVSPEISPVMIQDAVTLRNRLKESRDGVSAKIWAELDEDTKAILESDAPNLQRTLADVLKAQLSRDDLYDQNRFVGVQLRPETMEMLSGHQRDLKRDADLKALNRKLLEDVYSSELSKEWENQKEQTQLENQNPSNRVLIVGDGVVNQHDITEPIQWLMR
jgi:hypothetical protein